MSLDRHTRSNPGLAERVKTILASKNLTLHQVSQQSARLFGRESPYYLPHNLYYDLSRGNFSPSLFQFVSFSQISNYRLRDWLKIFGFDIESIPRVQIQLPAKRTALLESTLDDPQSSIPSLRYVSDRTVAKHLTPLSQLVEWGETRRLGWLRELNGNNFSYARIGSEDAMAFPELLPGSIVRINSRITGEALSHVTAEESAQLFLIQHARGFCCCHIRISGRGRMAIISTDLPYPEVEFRIPDEARIVGVVDLEIRPLSTAQLPSVAKALRRRWKPGVLAPDPSRLGQLLQRSRLRIGLSFRAASQMSRELATLMGDDRYFTAPGSLSDYETLNTPPRHFHKIVTFCAVYRLSLNAIFQALGLSLEDARRKPIPDLLTHESATIDIPTQAEFVAESGLVADLVVQLGGIPFFLRDALPALCELPRPSLNDIYWIGGTREPVHPFLAGGVLAVVNRQRKRPNGCGSKPLWQQPLYILLKRDGTHLCGCCNRENNSLVVHTYPGGTHKRVQIRGRDAEVIGKVVLVIRRLA